MKPKKKTKKTAPQKKKSKADKWIKRLSKKAQERIQREGYHLPKRSEAEQFEGLSDDLQDAWGSLRAKLLAFGEQEMRTTHRSIMFTRKTCYAFVRPKKAFIELNFFLPKALEGKHFKKVEPVSKTKWVHVFSLVHADQVEWPLTDWLKEAFDYAAGK